MFRGQRRQRLAGGERVGWRGRRRAGPRETQSAILKLERKQITDGVPVSDGPRRTNRVLSNGQQRLDNCSIGVRIRVSRRSVRGRVLESATGLLVQLEVREGPVPCRAVKGICRGKRQQHERRRVRVGAVPCAEFPAAVRLLLADKKV